MDINNRCPFCGEIADPTLLRSEYELANEGGNQTIGCPICKCHVVGTISGDYSLRVATVAELVNILVRHRMNRDKLISYIKKTKNLENVIEYFTDIKNLF